MKYPPVFRLVLGLAFVSALGPITMLADSVLRAWLINEGQGWLLIVAAGIAFGLFPLLAPWMGRLRTRTLENAIWLVAGMMLVTYVVAYVTSSYYLWVCGAGVLMRLFYRLTTRLMDRADNKVKDDHDIDLSWMRGEVNKVQGWAFMASLVIALAGDKLHVSAWTMAVFGEIWTLPITLWLVRALVKKL